MKHRAETKALRWLLSSAVVLGLMLPLRAPALAEGIPYIERSWDGSKVVEEKKYCTKYTVIDDDTEHLNGWYVVSGNVESDERLIVDDWAGIILCDGASLTLEEGINVPEGKTLNIYGGDSDTGRLIAQIGDNHKAAIGGDDEETNGAIYIHGGDITAVADVDAAGIGSGDDANAGPITIYGGKVYAKGGSTNSDGGAGIGGGGSGSATAITIYGGDVTAQGGANAAGIGGGDEGDAGTIAIYGGTVNATGGSEHTDGGAGIGGGDNGSSGMITINGGTVVASSKDNGAGIGGGSDGHCDSITINNGIVNTTGGSDGAGIGGGDCGNGGTITIRDGQVTATGGDNGAGIGGGNDQVWNTIEITGGTVNATGGAYGAGIGGGDRDSLTDGGTIKIGGTANVIARGGEEAAGIGGGEDITGGNITISDSATIDAAGGNNAAGIGGGDGAGGGSISIDGSVSITATGGGKAAGIGGGDNGSSGTIKIAGNGTITATAGENAAGIGGGYGQAWDTIEITGGTVTATGGSNIYNPEGGAGIGGGGISVYSLATGGTINIGGNAAIKAVGGQNSAGIGGGNCTTGGMITISSGAIEACGGKEGAGIGGGYDGEGGVINISGGVISTAKGGEGAAGIGGGFCGSGGKITITGGTITNCKGGAFADGYGGAGIGSGSYASGRSGKNSGGTITIDGDCKIDASGGFYAAGIGGGNYSSSGVITISDGRITATGGYRSVGIGSGYKCNETDDPVSVTIIGGTVKAIGGKYGSDSVKDDTDGGNNNRKYAGIGVGAESPFNGTINFNGGDVTVTQQVGLTDDEALEDSSGTVNFNGGRVRIDTQSEKAVIANVVNFNGPDQYVQYKDYDVSSPVVVPEDDRINTLTTLTGKEYIEVIPGIPSQTIEAEDVTVTYGETGKSVSGKSQQGGAISYAVKAGGEEYLAVDAATGALTIRKVPAEGKATVTVTAAAVEGYAETARDVTVTIQAADMSVTAADVKAAHDGKPHGIEVKVATPASGAKVAYGTKEGTYDQEASPTLTEAGTLTVYYKVTAENYRDFTGHATVTVAAADVETLNRAIEDALNYYDTIRDNERYADAAGALKTAIEVAQAAAGEGNLTDTELGEAINAITTALNDAREKVADIDAVQAVEAQIATLPEAAHVKAADWETIRAAREAYRALTDVQKQQVSAETLAKLEADEAALEKYGPAPETARYIRLTRKGTNAAETVAIGERVHVVPQYANDQGWPVIRMTASNRKVADIDPDTGELTLYRAGRVTIRVTAKNQKKSVTASVRVTVEDPTTPTRIGIDQGREIAVSVGKETNCQLTITAERLRRRRALT